MVPQSRSVIADERPGIHRRRNEHRGEGDRGKDESRLRTVHLAPPMDEHRGTSQQRDEESVEEQRRHSGVPLQVPQGASSNRPGRGVRHHPVDPIRRLYLLNAPAVPGRCDEATCDDGLPRPHHDSDRGDADDELNGEG